MSRPNIRLTIDRKHHGFTLVELMFTVVILAILSAVAVPAFREFIVNQRIKSASFDIMSTLILARSEAIKRNTNVDVAPSPNWQNGWAIKVGTAVLNQQSAMGNGVTSTCYSSGSVLTGCTTMTYTGNGRLSVTSPSIQLSSIASSSVRCIGIDLSGRPKSTKGTC